MVLGRRSWNLLLFPLLMTAGCECGAGMGGVGSAADAASPAGDAHARDPGEAASEATGRTPAGEDSDGEPDTPPATSLGAAGDRVDVGESDGVFVAPDYAVTGDTVLLVGDMNGDGRSEIAIGDRGYGLPGDHEHRGAVYLLYGDGDWGDGASLGTPDATLENTFAAGGFVELAAAGDVDADGFADLLVGFSNGTACGESGPAGRVFLVYGAPERMRDTVPIDTVGVELRGDAPCDATGLMVSGAGDLDGDGFADFMLTETANTSGGVSSRVHVFYGDGRRFESGGLEAAAVVLVSASSTFFGAGLASVGDVDGDGYDDILIGNQADAPETGTAWLLYGGKDRWTGSDTVDADDLSRTVLNSAAGSRPCAMGDLDGDSLADLGFVRQDESVAYYRGSADRLADGAEPTAILATERRRMGVCGSAGDLDGDGDTELYVTDPGYDMGRGVVYLVPGGTVLGGPMDLVDIAIAWLGRIYTDGDGRLTDRLGSAMSGGKDVNGDGLDDLVMGASDDHVGDITGGRMYLLLGRPD